jgi:hypothetical protein
MANPNKTNHQSRSPRKLQAPRRSRARCAEDRNYLKIVLPLKITLDLAGAVRGGRGLQHVEKRRDRDEYRLAGGRRPRRPRVATTRAVPRPANPAAERPQTKRGLTGIARALSVSPDFRSLWSSKWHPTEQMEDFQSRHDERCA